MGIRNMRTGDTIYAAWGEQYEVIEIEHESVKAKEIGTKHYKVFDSDKLECVDQDDGIWQEMIN